MWLRHGDRLFEVSNDAHIKRLLSEGYEETSAPDSTGDEIDLPDPGDRFPLEYLSSLNSEQIRAIASNREIEVAPDATKADIVAALLKDAGYSNQVPPPGPVKAS